jgi:hypothetical protein
MKSIRTAIFVVIVLTWLVYGQVRTHNQSGNFFETVPATVPTTMTDVLTGDVQMEALHLTSRTDSQVQCYVQDRQATPVPIMDGTKLDARAVFVVPLNGRLAPGGLSWYCTGPVAGWLKGRR